jgi:hypothetical protein
MPHEPVTTLAEYDALDPGDVIDGYEAARRGRPEPGDDRSRGYWHGWRVYMMGSGALPTTSEQRALSEAVRARLGG